MRLLRFGLPLVTVTMSLVAAPAMGQGPAEGRAKDAYGRLPMAFEANQGQADPAVEFLARGQGYAVALSHGQATLRLNGPRSSAIGLTLVDAQAAPVAALEHALPGRVSYFVGRDPAAWRTGIATYERVRYRDVYPGIDVVYYGNQGRLEYDFVVAPGASPSAIGLEFTGSRGMRLDDDGRLVIELAEGSIEQPRPFVYQDVDGARREVGAAYVADERGRVTFRVGAYDAAEPLVIDPTLVYATYLGGSASDNLGAIAVDAAGNAYLAGSTSSLDFPAMPGAFDTSANGVFGAFVAKLDPTGTTLVYATYLGGTVPLSPGGLASSAATGIAVDGSGSAYISGQAITADFPTTGGVVGPASFGSTDGFVAKLDPAGSTLEYATYLGGSFEDTTWDIALIPGCPGNCEAYVTGDTRSADFPATASAFAPALNGTRDAFVAKLDAGASALVYSTFLGGSSNGAVPFGSDQDLGWRIGVDGAGQAYVAGSTIDVDFPTTPGAFATTRNDAVPLVSAYSDLFVARIDPSESGAASLVYSTYLGGTFIEAVTLIDIAINPSCPADCDAYVTGRTLSADFPVTAGAFDTTFGGDDAFATRVNASGTALVYSTFIGGSSLDQGRAIAVDTSGNAYLTGDTRSFDFPTTPGATFETFQGSVDAFVVKLDSNGSHNLFGSYLGGGGGDVGFGIAVDPAGDVYVAGTTSGAFPVTPGAFDTSHNFGSDGFVARITPPPAVLDADNDGILDDDDACPNSDLSPTIVIDSCDTGVPNLLLQNGCTVSDLVAGIAQGAGTHGQFASGVSHLTNGLMKDGLISGAQKGAIQSCAGGAAIP